MKRRGLSLTEVLIAGALVLLLLLACEATMRHLAQVSGRARNQVEARQQVRAFVANLRNDLMGASYLYLGWTGTLLGQSVAVPGAGVSGDCLMFASPEDDSLDPRYHITLVYARPRTHADPNNPNVREVVYHHFTPQTSSPPATPGALNPSLLVPGASKVFDTYVPPGLTNLSFRPDAEGESVAVSVRFRVQPARGGVVSESFQTYVTLRNNV